MKIEFGNMRVASYNYENWGEDDDPKSDWSLLNKMAVFRHVDECEFILYVDGDNWDHWKEAGYSDELIGLTKAAKDQGYKYLCLYG